MYLAVTADHAHGQTATDRGVESYIRWRQATDKHSMWVGRLDPDYRFGKFRPGQLGNYHNELVPTGAIGGDCSNGASLALGYLHTGVCTFHLTSFAHVQIWILRRCDGQRSHRRQLWLG